MSDLISVDNERTCPACGNPAVQCEACLVCDGDGYTRFDIVNQIYEPCVACSGHGKICTCPRCGADYWQAKERLL